MQILLLLEAHSIIFLFIRYWTVSILVIRLPNLA